MNVLQNLMLEYQFQDACKTGNLKKAKQILKNNSNINISAYNERAFGFACEEGQLHVAQWLLQVKPNINISANNEFAFRYACANGHLHITQWLLSLRSINISVYDEYAFTWACLMSHLHIALYLQSLMPFRYNVQVENNKIVSYKINTNIEENLLFMLYSLTYKGFVNNLTANLVMDITKYI